MSVIIKGETNESEGVSGIACDESGCDRAFWPRGANRIVSDTSTLQEMARKRGWETRRTNDFGDTQDFCPHCRFNSRGRQKTS